MSQQPNHIGRYEVLRLIGEGAMGRVYLAADPLLKRWVAVKVVRDGADGRGEFLARFQREAEISARLNHPNLIRVYDVGEDPDQGPYLAMEYVEGNTVDQIIALGPLSNEVAMDLLIQAMEALEATHAMGIVHRDLKPANLRLAQSGRLCLLDFGIAREYESDRTATAHFIGSPAYAAPELLQSLPATEASDRWSFAATALELFTGRPAFSGATLGATLYRVSRGIPDFSNIRDLRMQRLFLQALDPEPDRRTPNLRAFLADLLGVLEITPEARSGLSLRIGESPSMPGHSTGVTPPSGTWMVWASRLGFVVLGLAILVVSWDFIDRKKGVGFGLKQGEDRVIIVGTDPPGAQVWINNSLIGNSPVHHSTPKKGTITVKVQMEGFWPVERALGTEETSLQINLIPTPFFVDVASRPSRANVYLDREFRGRTPLRRLQVQGAGHQIRIHLPGWRDFETRLDRGTTLPNPIQLNRADTEGR